jgi:hypothetical protein
MGEVVFGILRSFDATTRKADVELMGGDGDYLVGVQPAAHITTISAGAKVVLISFGPEPADYLLIGSWG